MSESIFDDAALASAARMNFARRISNRDAKDVEGGPRERIAAGLYMRAKVIDRPFICAASTIGYLSALRDATHSGDVAAAHRPDAICGELTLIDPYKSLAVWIPDEDSCPGCVEGVLEPEKAETAETP